MSDYNPDELLKLHHLRPAPGSNKAKTRKGRGEG
ncbi:MAG TPA: 50S ribosomal protein L15, partial [Candidatus Nocardiopsis merdipullorum]|nr:50S ribosomal protein L15 [Candidatus Nocardiopsis merdipullorum]